MSSIKLISNIFLPAVICANIAMAHASHENIQNITCPTVEELKQFDFEFAAPYGFDNKTKSLKFMTYEYGFMPNTEQSWDFFLYPVKVKSSHDVEGSIKTVVDALEPVSGVPFEYKIGDEVYNDLCIYTLPGDEDVQAIAMLGFNDGNMDDDNYLTQSNKKKHARVLRMAKQLMSR